MQTLQHPGVVSGKLSDFAGLFMVSLGLFTVFPRHKRQAGAALCALFFWWKSPASEPFIELVQDLGVVFFGRTVDYTDLLALAMLPLAARVADASDAWQIPTHRLKRLVALPAIAAAGFAILGTSYVTYEEQYQIRTAAERASLDAADAAAAIKVVAERHAMQCTQCGRLPDAARYAGNDLTMDYEIKDPGTIVFSISGFPSGLFFSRNVEGKMDALKADLKEEFRARFRNLEFVEPLRRRFK